MFAACLTHGKQTNHCKMTMVWWENDISILFAVLQRSRDSVWRDHVTVCVCITLKALVREAVCTVVEDHRDHCRVVAEFIGEISEDVEDGGKSWSREGQEEEVSRK